MKTRNYVQSRWNHLRQSISEQGLNPNDFEGDLEGAYLGFHEKIKTAAGDQADNLSAIHSAMFPLEDGRWFCHSEMVGCSTGTVIDNPQEDIGRKPQFSSVLTEGFPLDIDLGVENGIRIELKDEGWNQID